MAGQPLVGQMTQHDKILAAVGHAAIIVPVLGIVVPLGIWATRRQKSTTLAFQALQAAAYHAPLILTAMFCGICFVCAHLGGIVEAARCPPSGTRCEPLPGEGLAFEPPIAQVFFFLVGILVYLLVNGAVLLILATGLAYVAYGLYAAVVILRGEDFRYRIIGPRLERYLEQT